jgi:hypothetical protein
MRSTSWQALLLKLTGTPKQQIIAAVDLVNFAIKSDSGRPFLRTTCEAAGNQFVAVGFLRADGTTAAGAKLGLPMIRESAATPEDLVLQVFAAAFPETAHTKRSDCAIGGSLPYRTELSELAAGTVHTERTSLVIRRLTDGNSCRLIGQSSSGKTTTALQVALHLSTQGWSVCWLDLSQPDRGVRDLLVFFTSTPAPERGSVLVVLDDCQANPSEATRIVRTINQVAPVLAIDVRMMVLAWESSSAFVERLLPDSVVVPCSGGDVIPEIAREVMSGISDEHLDEIVASSSGDVLLARLQLKALKDSGRLPTFDRLSDAVLRQTATGAQILSEEQARLLFRLASMSQFEIDTSIDYFHEHDRSVLASLEALRFVRRTGHFVSVGHRSMAKLLLGSLTQRYAAALSGLPKPGQIAVEYVRGAPPQQLVTTLERLDLARLSRGGTQRGEQHGTAFLARAWESLLMIVDMVAKQTVKDPSWSDNTGSACFAGEALAEVAHPSWKELAKYVRGRWSAPDMPGSIQHSGSSPPAERSDFEQIRLTMKAEDEEAALLGVEVSQELADAIDLDRMHRTWVLGLLLGFEGTAREPDTDRLRRLKECAEASQEPNGSFYPSRVPWVTARVLLGLAAAGESVRTNKVVKRACDWLRQSAPDGPYQFGTWESGTGAWNTTLATTAMCTAALTECGVPTSDPCVRTATEYLIGQKDDWSRAGQEIDGAFAMASVLAVRGKWREVSRELERLIAWMRAKESWASATMRADEVHDESCKVAQIAGALIAIVWTIVRRELPLLLEDLSSDLVQSRSEPARPRYNIASVLQAIDRIDTELAELIRGGEKSVEESAEVPAIVRDSLARRRTLRSELIAIRTTIGAGHTNEGDDFERLAARVNDMGQELFTRTWISVLPVSDANA